MDFKELMSFYSGKNVFITGDTGFKGSWLSLLLLLMGANVYGYALENKNSPALFEILDLSKDITHITGDVRDFNCLYEAYKRAKPDLVFHLAAQPIVRESYKNPRYTYETNVMGTVNILECLRLIPGAGSFLNVTTDKVYENQDISDYAFREDDKLDGHDPYSNSKSCSELVTHSYKKSFFYGDGSPAISTARAGNVIGGGDFAEDRIIPDCVRASIRGESIKVRNPFSVRPYQHVLEPLFLYLNIAMAQYDDNGKSGYYNIGPLKEDCIETGKLADIFVREWGEGAKWKDISEEGAPHEANFLRLNCSKVQEIFGWKPVWNAETAIKKTVEWYKAWNAGNKMADFTGKQIDSYIGV